VQSAGPYASLKSEAFYGLRPCHDREQWFGSPGRLAGMSVSALSASYPSNTRDQLRGAHDLALVHDERADDDASTRLQPPLVSCIALFDSTVRPS
jgi:hypothetical protein